jgi:hypothetical protein
MRRLLALGAALLACGCASLMGVNPDYLDDYSVYGLTKNGIEAEYGFNRLLMMNVVIVDNTGTFNTDSNVVNVHFDGGKSHVFPEDKGARWAHNKGRNQYEGLLIAQAKFDRVQLDFVTVGTHSSGWRSTETTRVDIKVNRPYSTKKSHLNHLGTLVVMLDGERKRGVSYGYRTKVRTSDVFVQVRLLEPGEDVLQGNLRLLRRLSPATHAAFAGSLHRCF